MNPKREREKERERERGQRECEPKEREQVFKKRDRKDIVCMRKILSELDIGEINNRKKK